jgi:hypothetical protein
MQAFLMHENFSAADPSTLIETVSARVYKAWVGKKIKKN